MRFRGPGALSPGPGPVSIGKSPILMSMSETPITERGVIMKLNEIKSAIEEWEGKLREAQANFDSAVDLESEFYNRVVLYERECDAHPECESLSDILVNEVYPEYDEAYKVRKEAEERAENAERVIDALKELKEAMEEWQGV